MKKITVTFRCDCGYIETAEVINLPFLGEMVNDYIQFGKIYILAKEHAKVFHNKKLDFSLIEFVNFQRLQRAQKREEIKKFKEMVKNGHEDNPELTHFLEQIKRATEQKRIHDEWQHIKETE